MSWLVLLLVCTAPEGMPAAVSADTSVEYKVKAAYLYHFLNFIDWPREAAETPSAPFRLCLAGEDPFGVAIDPLKRKTAKRRPVTIKRLSGLTAARECHVLFVGDLQSEQLRALFEQLAGHDVLTVGETDEFLELGGIIRFFLQRDKVRVELNLDAARQAGLKVHAKLIEVSRIRRR